MTTLPISQLKQVELYPSNRSNSANVWSANSGSTIISFTIGENNAAYLRSSSLRLHFKLRLRTSATPEAYPNNLQANVAAPLVSVLQDPKIGALSCFSSITVSSASTNAALERAMNAPRLAASLIATNASFKDYSTHLQLRTGGTANANAQARRQNAEMEICTPINCGMFLAGEDIPLGGNAGGGQGRGCGGCTIKLFLSPSIESNFSANSAGSYYQIVNPSLSFVLAFPEGGLPLIKSLPYTSFSSFYNTISTGDETINVNAGLSSVISVFNNFLPTQNIANQIENSNTTQTLRNAPYASDADYAPVEFFTTMVGGLKTPYAFTVNESANIEDVAGQYSANYTAQRQRNFLSALLPSKSRTRTLASNLSEQGLGVSRVPVEDLERYQTAGDHCYGIGARFDGASVGAGIDLSKQTFSYRIRSKLNNSPNSIFTWFLHRNLIGWTQNGIAVSN
jgi:hypothetical protein